jgi:hypothetical protein
MLIADQPIAEPTFELEETTILIKGQLYPVTIKFEGERMAAIHISGEPIEATENLELKENTS